MIRMLRVIKGICIFLFLINQDGVAFAVVACIFEILYRVCRHFNLAEPGLNNYFLLVGILWFLILLIWRLIKYLIE